MHALLAGQVSSVWMAGGKSGDWAPIYSGQMRSKR